MARAEARKLLGKMSEGVDLNVERREQRAIAAEPSGGPTLRDAYNAHLDKMHKRNRSPDSIATMKKEIEKYLFRVGPSRGGRWLTTEGAPGLGPQRFRERRGRGHYDDRLVAELAGVEWGTFLGPGHLARLDLDQVRASGAFACIREVTPQLAYLQVSDDPADDLTEGLETKLQAARRALAPLLMDVTGISLE